VSFSANRSLDKLCQGIEPTQPLDDRSLNSNHCGATGASGPPGSIGEILEEIEPVQTNIFWG